MARIVFDKINSGNSIIDRIQDNIQKAFSRLAFNPYNNPIVVTVNFVAGVPQVLNTGFANGELQGYQCRTKTAACDPYEITRTANTITLQADTTATVEIQFY